MNVQIFGTKKSNETKKALRFFKERGLKPHFVDLQARDASPGELKRFAQQGGLDALLDREAKAYEEEGLAYMRLSDEQLMARLIANPKLLVQPLVRSGKTLSVGWDETLWRNWYEDVKG